MPKYMTINTLYIYDSRDGILTEKKNLKIDRLSDPGIVFAVDAIRKIHIEVAGSPGLVFVLEYSDSIGRKYKRYNVWYTQPDRKKAIKVISTVVIDAISKEMNLLKLCESDLKRQEDQITKLLEDQ